MKIAQVRDILVFMVFAVLPTFRAAITRISITTVHAPNLARSIVIPRPLSCVPTEATTGFDDQSIDPLFVSNATHNQDQLTFDQVDNIPDGLGPFTTRSLAANATRIPFQAPAARSWNFAPGVIEESGAFLQSLREDHR